MKITYWDDHFSILSNECYESVVGLMIIIIRLEDSKNIKFYEEPLILIDKMLLSDATPARKKRKKKKNVAWLFCPVIEMHANTELK